MKFIHLKRESTNGIINSRGQLATDLGEATEAVQSDSMRPQLAIEHSGYETWFKLSVFFLVPSAIRAFI
jgi:hypothetical protein